jgi:RimJ/RimL family protein N-acetyltransferase
MQPLHTERLVLRMFTVRDLAPYAAMCADPEVMRHIGSGGPVDAATAWRHLALYLGAWSLQGYGMWAVERKRDGVLIGRAGFLDPPGWPGCEIGWLLARDAWGAGYAHEAAAAALADGRARCGLRGVISLIRPENTRSIVLAERLGATREGMIDFMGGSTLLYRHPDRAG